jgi:hydroxyacylglutathione hydrolase
MELQSAVSSLAEPLGEARVTELKPGIYQITSPGKRGCHVYVLKGSNKTLMIDAGLPQDFPALSAGLAKIGLTPSDIHIILLTHEHMDHVGGVPFFPPQAVVAAHGLAAGKVRLQDEFVMMNHAFGVKLDNFHIDIWLEGETEFDLGGMMLKVIHTPGHCSGAISLYESTHQVLFTGDVVFAGGTLGGIFASGNISDYIHTLKRLTTLRISEFYPGHGRISLKPQEDLDRAIELAQSLVSDTRELFKALDAGTSFDHILRSAAGYSRPV